MNSLLLFILFDPALFFESVPELVRDFFGGRFGQSLNFAVAADLPVTFYYSANMSPAGLALAIMLTAPTVPPGDLLPTDFILPEPSLRKPLAVI